MTIEERVLHIKAADSSDSAADDFVQICSSDPRFFINNCLWIFEPRSNTSDERDIPYLLRPFQEDVVYEAAHHIYRGEDLLIDKTREMGATWMVLATILYFWIFDHGFTALGSSLTEEKIDKKGDPNCMFWKFDYLLASLAVLPDRVKNRIYPSAYFPSMPTMTHMVRRNPNGRAVFRGEVMGPNLGRSGRSKMIFLDEFAEAPEPEATWSSSARTSPCRLVVFTPKGMNFAGQLANPPPGKRASIDRIRLHWMIDPSKNYFHILSDSGKIIATGNGHPTAEQLNLHGISRVVYPWYEDAKIRLNNDPVAIGQELDIDYRTSVEGLMYPQISKSGRGRFRYDPSLPLYCSMDYGLEDDQAIIWWQYDTLSGRLRAIDAFSSSGKTIRWYIPFLTGRDISLGASEGGYNDREREIIHRHRPFYNRYVDFYGDPAGRIRNQVTNSSVVQVLAQYGIYVISNSRENGYEARKFKMASALPYTDFDEVFCHDLIQCISQSRQGATGIPVHDGNSHYRSAAEYFYINQPHGLYAQETIDYHLGRLRSEDRSRSDSYSGDHSLYLEELARVDAERESVYARLIRGEDLEESSFFTSSGGYSPRRSR